MSLASRVHKKYREGGLSALFSSSLRFVPRWYCRQVFWVRLGKLSALLARHIKTLSPSILVISFPRSGSSWVGETLGSAPNALYLSEPINQSFLSSFPGKVFVDPSNQQGPAIELYKHLTERSFCGLPSFPAASANPVMYPEQWSLTKRRSRRLVIKEVNPLATEFFLRQYRPRVVLLVRHPASITLSGRKLGWWNSIGEREGAMVGCILRTAWDALRDYDDRRVVMYENLCATPVHFFRELFDFAGFKWSETVERLVQYKTSGGDPENPGSTNRDSKSMIDAWRGQVRAEEIRQLKIGYETFQLPWYASPEDW